MGILYLYWGVRNGELTVFLGLVDRKVQILDEFLLCQHLQFVVRRGAARNSNVCKENISLQFLPHPLVKAVNHQQFQSFHHMIIADSFEIYVIWPSHSLHALLIPSPPFLLPLPPWFSEISSSSHLSFHFSAFLVHQKCSFELVRFVRKEKGNISQICISWKSRTEKKERGYEKKATGQILASSLPPFLLVYFLNQASPTVQCNCTALHIVRQFLFSRVLSQPLEFELNIRIGAPEIFISFSEKCWLQKKKKEEEKKNKCTSSGARDLTQKLDFTN